jgi:hypothetical protein
MHTLGNKMFIYKITVGTKVYIGFDSKPEYKEHRWKTHCNIARYGKGKCKTKLHIAMKKRGVENCTYEVIESGFTKMVDLALAEIRYIREYNSYRRGLNSTPGGDGLGKRTFAEMTDDEIALLRGALGVHWTKWNQKKWGNTTIEERREKTAHLHTPQIYEQRAETLKKFYKANPEAKTIKGKKIKEWQEQNKDIVKANNKKNGLLGAAKRSKPVAVEWENGKGETFNSRKDFERQTGLWFSTLVEKSKQGVYYKGYKLKDDNE